MLADRLRARAPLGLALLAATLLTGTSTHAEVAQIDRDLLLATWNIEHLTADDGAGCRPRTPADYRALRTMGTQLAATVIAVQEVEDEVALARVFDPAEYDLEMSRRPDGQRRRCRRQSGQTLTEQRTGFAIHRARLAALGLAYQRKPDLKALRQNGSRHGTWVLLMRAADEQPVLHLLAIHLKSGCAWDALDDGQPTRRHQCTILRRQRGVLEEWIDTRVARGEPFVVIGDFNRQLDQPNDHFWSDIADGEVCRWQPDADLGRRCIPGTTRPAPDADLVLANAGRPFPRPHNRKYPYAIDHLVMDARTGTWVKPGSYRVFDYPDPRAPLSDHHPIRLTLRLPTPP